MTRSPCDNNVLFDVLSDACLSIPFTVGDKPVVVRGYNLGEDERIVLEMIGGSGPGGDFFEQVQRGCGCCVSLTACNNELILTVSGSYRLNRCVCALSPVSNAYVEWQTVDSGVTNFGSNTMACACSDGSKVSVTRNPDNSVTFVVDGVATTIAAPSAPGTPVSATVSGDNLILTVAGVSYILDLGADTPASVALLFALVDCGGAPITPGTAVATCANLTASTAASATATLAAANTAATTAIAASAAATLAAANTAATAGNPTTLPPSGQAGGAPTDALNGTYPSPGLNVTYLDALLAYKDCTGTSINHTATLATCSDLATAIAGIPATIPDASGTVRGFVNNVANQELGGIGKRIHGIDIWRSSLNDGTNTAVGATAGFGNTANLISAFGQFSLLNNSGPGASGFGRNALSGNTGPFATGIGYGAGETSTAVNLTAIGAFAGQAGTAADSVYAGYQAGDSADGARSIGIGVASLVNNQGIDVVAVGRTSGFGNTFNNVVLLGNGTAATADNQTQIGNAAMLDVRTAGAMSATAFNNISDSRNKTQVKAVEQEAAIAISKMVSISTFMLMSSWTEKAQVALQNAMIDEQNARKVPAPKKGEPKIERLVMDRIEFAGQRELWMGAGVIAQELQALTEKLGAYQWLVREAVSGELTVDYISLYAIITAGIQFRLEAAGI